MKEWTTVRIRRAAYDKLKALAESTGESLGEVSSVAVADGVDNLAAAGDALVKALDPGPRTTARGIVKPSHRDPGDTTFTMGEDGKPDANRDDSDDGDDGDKAATASYKNGKERNAYECGLCHEIWDVGTKPKSPCPGCGADLIYPEDNPGEDQDGGMSGGEKALLFGAGVLALVAYARWQAARNPTGAR